MGFTTAATAATVATVAATAATVLPKALEAKSAYEQGKALDQTAAEQQRLANSQAASIEKTAVANQIRGSRNAHAELAHARTDAAVSNTLQEGSTYVRGADLATRLQDEINATANEQLTRANQMRSQGAYNAWDLRNQGRQSRAQAVGALASGVGSLLSGVATGLAGYSAGSTAPR